MPAARNLVDKRVERAYYARCKNIEINMMDINKVFAHGRAVCATGADDEQLKQAIFDFVQSIKLN